MPCLVPARSHIDPPPCPGACTCTCASGVSTSRCPQATCWRRTTCPALRRPPPSASNATWTASVLKRRCRAAPNREGDRPGQGGGERREEKRRREEREQIQNEEIQREERERESSEPSPSGGYSLPPPPKRAFNTFFLGLRPRSPALAFACVPPPPRGPALRSGPQRSRKSGLLRWTSSSRADAPSNPSSDVHLPLDGMVISPKTPGECPSPTQPMR